MANQIIFGGTIAPANTAMEVSINGAITMTPLAFTTVGAGQEGTLTGVPGATYAIGQLVMGAVGYPATRVSNPVARTVAAPAFTLKEPLFDSLNRKAQFLMSAVVADFGAGRPNKYYRTTTNFGTQAGVSYNTPLLGTLLYSSTDLHVWTREDSLALTMPLPKLDASWNGYDTMERPAILRIAATGKWYLYAHTVPSPTTSTYSTYADSKIAIYEAADSAAGPVGPWVPKAMVKALSNGALDFSLFTDPVSGKRYMVSSVNDAAITNAFNVRVECAEILADGISFGPPLVRA